jgi:N-methylhydantoinase B/oxoprolinase/acetone carboxylase alpha subunit
MAGGEPGQAGSNYWYRRKIKTKTKTPSWGSLSSEEESKSELEPEPEFTVINLGGSNQCRMKAGDRIVISQF